MTNKTDWQTAVGRSWADLYNQTDRSFTGLTQHLLERIAALPGNAILDIGCGAGELTLAMGRARPGANINGVDVSADLVEAAKQRGSALGNIHFTLADAAQWSPEGSAPDLLISRHGVMFFDHPVAAFTHLRTIAAPGANLIFSCFRSPQENRWMSDIAAMLPVQDDALPSDPQAPGPFAFAEPQHVRTILTGAGWQDIAIEPFDFAYIAGMGEDPVADAMAFFSRIGPAAAALRALDGDVQVQVRSSLIRWLEEHRSGNMVLFPAAAWIVTAQKV
jgi:SAM-dependent methyltransferase